MEEVQHNHHQCRGHLHTNNYIGVEKDEFEAYITEKIYSTSKVNIQSWGGGRGRPCLALRRGTPAGHSGEELRRESKA
jgi:hypothetical protein